MDRRVEILIEVVTFSTSRVSILEHMEDRMITPKQAIKAMTRFAEMAFIAAKEQTLQPYVGGFQHRQVYVTFEDWLSQQEGGSNERK